MLSPTIRSARLIAMSNMSADDLIKVGFVYSNRRTHAAFETIVVHFISLPEDTNAVSA